MNKIGIATVHTGYNYGSSLQAFATKMILRELGYEGVSLSQKGSLVNGRDIRIKKVLMITLKMLLQPNNIKKRMLVYSDNINKPYSQKTKELFDKFRNEKINPSQYTWNELKKEAHSEKFTAFICGSDQIWNSEALYVDPQYYLRFSPKEKRIAFAPSFGRNYIAKYNEGIISKYIKDIPYISVREETGVPLIEALTDRKAVQLIDPTLVLDSKKWDKYLGIDNEKEHDQPYILAYFLNEPSIFAKKYILQLAEMHNLRVIALPYNRSVSEWFDSSPDAGPIEFIKYIKNASYVCTDSFHGTAFAVNYEVPFYTFEREYGKAGKQSSRLESFLKIVSLEIFFNPSIELLGEKADFSKSRISLEAERLKSIQYLTESIGGVGK